MGSVIKFFPHFPHFSLDLDKIQHRLCQKKSIVREFSENGRKESHTSLTNVNELVSILRTFYRLCDFRANRSYGHTYMKLSLEITVKPYDIQNVKKLLVMFCIASRITPLAVSSCNGTVHLQLARDPMLRPASYSLKLL